MNLLRFGLALVSIAAAACSITQPEAGDEQQQQDLTGTGGGSDASVGSSAHLVISQIYTRGGTAGALWHRDFIELFNPTNATISLEDYSLQYADGANNIGEEMFNDAGAGYRQTVLPLVSTIGPGRFVLFAMGGPEHNGSGGDLQADHTVPDAFAMSYRLDVKAGKIALVRGKERLGCGSAANRCGPAASSRLVDLVGYGPASDFEGTGTADDRLGDPQISIRRDDPCIDRNDNRRDFSFGLASPRASDTPAVHCSHAGF